jgi:hypothetical protein
VPSKGCVIIKGDSFAQILISVMTVPRYFWTIVDGCPVLVGYRGSAEHARAFECNGTWLESSTILRSSGLPAIYSGVQPLTASPNKLFKLLILLK